MKRKSSGPVRFHMVLRSRVKKELQSIAALPEEIISNILLLLPADILYAVMRYVCRQWYLIINDPGFIATHLHRSTSILLVQFPNFHGQYLHVRGCDFKFSDMKLQFPGDVLATCNGLTLVRDRRYETTHMIYYIANPVTNRIMTLPTFPLNVWDCSLVFVASSNTYKVVVVTEERMNQYYKKYECAILTVNVDRAWRIINCADVDNFSYFFTSRLIMNRGYVYWPDTVIPHMLALNLESESFKSIPLPQTCRGKRGKRGLGHLRPKGNTVSYIHTSIGFHIEVWVLKDHETEDWIRFPDLIVEELRREGTSIFSLSKFLFHHGGLFLYPIGWSNNEERILFHMLSEPNSLLVYDVKTGGTFTLIMGIDGVTMCAGHRLPKTSATANIFPHVSSLTWV